jgi:DNA polymerase elongation subunit (family B)
MTTLILDLETRPDPAMGAYSDDPAKFPPPPYHMVTTAAWLTIDMGRPARAPGDVSVPPSAVFGVAQGERHALRTIAEMMAKRPRVVTWNGRGFDLPVIAMRSMKHQIPQQALLCSKPDYLYRYSDKAHCDLMDAVSLLGAGPRCSQHDVARMLGLPGKHVGHGADVASMTPEEEAAYCLDDVAQAALISCEWRRVQGFEVEPVRDLIMGAIEAEPRLVPLWVALTGASGMERGGRG